MLKRIFTQTFITMSVVILVIISSAVETDIFVPSFPAIQDFFATTESRVQMIIGVNFFGICIASLFYGPLSDAYGRRPVLLAGMLLFALASIACVLAPTMESLLFWRFIQGLGSSVAFVVPGAIIYDVFDKEKAAKMLGLYNSIITFAMSLAPIIGSFLYLTFDWRANFIFVAALAIIALIFSLIFVHETLAIEQRGNMHLPTILKGYKKLLLHPKAMANLYIICAVCGGYFAYIANLSLIFVNYLGVSETLYSYYQAVILLIFAGVSVCSGRVIAFLGMYRTRRLGMRVTVLGAVLLFGVALLVPTPIAITLAMSVFTAGFALSMGVFFGDYMSVYPEIKGIASSLANSIRLLLMSLTIALSGWAFDGTIMPVAIIVFVAGISALLAQRLFLRND